MEQLVMFIKDKLAVAKAQQWKLPSIIATDFALLSQPPSTTKLSTSQQQLVRRQPCLVGQQ